ncbi:hypothetical protein FGO68_gene6066 [Halteria grandinella]|uniref:RING-type domain-containing protein n=1 Tax=Halteria grandinella TaxID=5974 RepID=A0A8J8T4H3_HALGN|nr:hypothetical protein FGO68_gene6066 [Halteria grandinella]
MNDILNELLDFRCTICFQVLREPLKCSQCKNHFCKRCISKWLLREDQQRQQTCPFRCKLYLVRPGSAQSNFGGSSEMDGLSFPEADFLERLKSHTFPCTNQGNGCLLSLKYPILLEHEKQCEYASVNCLAHAQCRSILLRKDIHLHQAKCRFLSHGEGRDLMDGDVFAGSHQRSYGSICDENERLKRENSDKEVLIQNLMEKVNYLQRRVVFLENELADAARSPSQSDEEDENRYQRIGSEKKLSQDQGGNNTSASNAYQKNEGLNQDLRALMLWEEQVLDTFGEDSPHFNNNHLLKPMEERKSLDQLTEDHPSNTQQQVSFDLTLTQPTQTQNDAAPEKAGIFNQGLLLHQINNHFWYYPKCHGGTQSLSTNEVFSFDDNTVTFKVSDSNKIYLLQAKIHSIKFNLGTNGLIQEKVKIAKDLPTSSAPAKSLSIYQQVLQQQVTKPKATTSKLQQFNVKIIMPDDQIGWPNDAYLLIGLLPRDARSRFRAKTGVEDITEYIATFSQSFYKFHEVKAGLKRVELSLTCSQSREGILDIAFDSKQFQQTKKRGQSPTKGPQFNTVQSRGFIQIKKLHKYYATAEGDSSENQKLYLTVAFVLSSSAKKPLHHIKLAIQ